ncbi:DsrE family protein [Sulfuricurvum sp.]|uniref:DsrE family protein n=1 Tax=Sulfuricurvum sp. TaxID=2025608 RepID=UPI002D595F4E|nr:DsrE family protein [Sulfuricurvum sp.]HZF71440.1 DsrE family protein [Sulfuricurvum sp.]
MKTKKTVALMIAFLATFAPLQAQQVEDETIKIVYQCDFSDEERFNRMINTLNNLVSQYQQNLTDYKIDVVALGSCLPYVMKDFTGTSLSKTPNLEETQKRLSSLMVSSGNVKLLACQNTMKKKNVKPEQILDKVELTPSGIAKVIEDQRNGYAYININ